MNILIERNSKLVLFALVVWIIMKPMNLIFREIKAVLPLINGTLVKCTAVLIV